MTYSEVLEWVLMDSIAVFQSDYFHGWEETLNRFNLSFRSWCANWITLTLKSIRQLNSVSAAKNSRECVCVEKRYSAEFHWNFRERWSSSEMRCIDDDAVECSCGLEELWLVINLKEWNEIDAYGEPELFDEVPLSQPYRQRLTDWDAHWATSSGRSFFASEHLNVKKWAEVAGQECSRQS